MAISAKKTVAIGRRTGSGVMLAQTGAPTRARPEGVGIFQAAVTPHAGDGVDTVLGDAGTAEVDHSQGGNISAAMAVVTVGADIRAIQVGGMETRAPVIPLCRRDVGTALPKAGVALGAISDRIDIL